MLFYILLCSSDYIFDHLFMVTMHFLFLFTLIACVLLSIVSEPFSNLIETWMLIAYFYRCPSNSHGYLFNTLLCYVPTQFSTMSGAIKLGSATFTRLSENFVKSPISLRCVPLLISNASFMNIYFLQVNRYHLLS